MTKQEILNFSPKEAFNHGKESKNNGKSIDYNPYRNTGLNDSALFNAWVLGWNS